MDEGTKAGTFDTRIMPNPDGQIVRGRDEHGLADGLQGSNPGQVQEPAQRGVQVPAHGHPVMTGASATQKPPRPLKAVDKAYIRFRVRPDLHTRLLEEAAEEGRSISSQVERIVMRHFLIKDATTKRPG